MVVAGQGIQSLLLHRLEVGKLLLVVLGGGEVLGHRRGCGRCLISRHCLLLNLLNCEALIWRHYCSDVSLRPDTCN